MGKIDRSGAICYICSMNKADQKKLVDYWKKTAEHDYETMAGLFQIGRYDAVYFSDTLFSKKHSRRSSLM